MNRDEKAITRLLFKNKIYDADGQKFEDLFIDVMGYIHSDFQAIKPWGKIGDRKNDGYIKSLGIYYQVYAPEDIRKTYANMVNKIETDFKGLLSHWNPVNEFYFVVNDKYRGVHPDSEKTIVSLKKKHVLDDSGIKTARDLENAIFKLDDDQVTAIVGFIPDPANLKVLDYSILYEVIQHIMETPVTQNDSEFSINLPDFKEKIEFNNLTETTSIRLYNGLLQISKLEEYLSRHGNFVAEDLRIELTELYTKLKNGGLEGDDLFWRMVGELSPRDEFSYQSTVIVIMSKYFESCDIFEEPDKHAYAD